MPVSGRLGALLDHDIFCRDTQLADAAAFAEDALELTARMGLGEAGDHRGRGDAPHAGRSLRVRRPPQSPGEGPGRGEALLPGGSRRSHPHLGHGLVVRALLPRSPPHV